MKKKRRFSIEQKYMIPLILAAMWIFLSLITPSFRTLTNINNLLRQTSIYGICAVGMTFIIICAQCDLSMGAILGLSGMVCTWCLTHNVPIVLSILAALLVGVLSGCINGLIVVKTKIPAFIATLGTCTIARGLANMVSNGAIISNLPDEFKSIASTKFLKLPVLVWVFIILVIIGQFILSKTIIGRNIYACGSNAEVARLSGIAVEKYIVGVYAIAGFCASIGGVLYASRLAQGMASAGSGYELDAITAAVIGGASFFGGEGTIIGAVFGAFITTTLRNGGNLLKLNSFLMEVIIGIVTILAVTIDTLNKRSKR